MRNKPDPLAHETPWLSPYVFCGGDPINFFDPDGMKRYFIDMTGHIVSPEVALNHSEYDKYKDDIEDDQIVIVNKDGMVVHASDTYAPGTITAKTVQYEGEEVTSFEIKDNTIAVDVFENLAQNSTVEWGHIQATNNSDNQSINLIGTSSQEEWNSANGYFIDNVLSPINSYVHTIIHSHVKNGCDYPSGLDDGSGDIRFARYVMGKYNQNINFMIYLPASNDYIPYTHKSVSKDFNLPSNGIALPQLVVNNKR